MTYTDFNYAECHKSTVSEMLSSLCSLTLLLCYAEIWYIHAECIMLNVIMLTVVMLNVLAPYLHILTEVLSLLLNNSFPNADLTQKLKISSDAILSRTFLSLQICFLPERVVLFTA